MSTLNLGFGIQQKTIYKGKRSCTFEAFLRPVMNRENLHVATEAHVTKESTVFKFICRIMDREF